MKNQIAIISILFASILLMSNCSNQKESVSAMDIQSQSVFGKWKFVSFADGKKTDFKVSLELSNTLSQDGKYTINGKGSVNFYFAYFTIDEAKKSFVVSTLGSTKMAGSPAEMEFETNYFGKFGKVVKYEILGENLILHLPTSEKEKLIFSRES